MLASQGSILHPLLFSLHSPSPEWAHPLPWCQLHRLPNSCLHLTLSTPPKQHSFLFPVHLFLYHSKWHCQPSIHESKCQRAILGTSQPFLSCLLAHSLPPAASGFLQAAKACKQEGGRDHIHHSLTPISPIPSSFYKNLGDFLKDKSNHVTSQVKDRLCPKSTDGLNRIKKVEEGKFALCLSWDICLLLALGHQFSWFSGPSAQLVYITCFPSSPVCRWQAVASTITWANSYG